MKQRSLVLLMTLTVLIAAPVGCGGDANKAQHTGGLDGGTSSNAQTAATGGTSDTASSTTGGSSRTGTLTSKLVGTSTQIDTHSAGSHSLSTGGVSSQSGGSSTGSNLTLGGGGAGGMSSATGATTNTLGGTSSNAGGTSGSAGATNALTCSAPACCAPLLLAPSRVDVYRVQDALIVNLVVQPSDADAINALWTPYADISTSWGGAQTCTIDRRFGKGVTHITLSCPPVQSTEVDCGRSTSIQVRLRADTFSGVQPFGLECQGATSEPWTTITVPVKCPVCPSSSSFFGYQPCDYPEAPSGSDIPLCSVFSQPCHCLPNGTAGSKLWSCPQP